MKHWFIGVLLSVTIAIPEAVSFENDAPLDDPALEARARELAKHIRCLVCQNQSIFDSDADLAKDLRQIVRERIMSGESDRAITGYLVERYGDFVLLRPPVKPKTYLLWFGPAIIIFFAGAGVVRFLRRTGASGGRPEALNSAERRQVKSLISDEEVD